MLRSGVLGDIRRTFIVLLIFFSSALTFETASLCQLSSFDNANAKGNAFYIEHIPEDWPVGTSLSHLSINGTSADITLTTSVPSEYLSFDPLSRNITVVKALRIGENGERMLRMTLLCQRNSRLSTIKIPVTVLLEDINDSPPVFQKFSYSASVSELASVGTTVISSIVADDADPENWLVTYNIADSKHSSYLSIPIPSRGEIVLVRPLDYEFLQKIHVTVVAKDNHLGSRSGEQTQLSSSARVTVTVRDEDDLNPIFFHPVSFASVIENDISGKRLTVKPELRAYDPDLTFNSTLHYTFVHDPLNDEDSYFSIEPTSGAITLRRDALRRGSLFSLLVKATQTDNADRYATTLLRVSVQAANENAPKFKTQHQVTTLLENAPIGSFVTTVSAIDNDQGAVLEYKFSRIEYEVFFSIDSKSGTVRTALGLDYERISQHDLMIQVTDGMHTDEMELTVNLIDINDNNPEFGKRVYRFLPDLRIGDIIGTLQVYDADSDTKFTFELLQNTTLFSINDLGEIRLLTDPNTLTTTEYELYARVQDNKGPSPRQDVTRILISFDLQLPVKAEQQMGSVAIIILGVMVGCLLIVVALMMLHVCKSNRKDPSTNVVRSRSFDGDLNLDGAEYKSYYDDGTEGLAYKSNPRHLSLYTGITLDSQNSTALQENPFSDSITPRFIRDGNTNTAYMTQASDSTAVHSLPQSSIDDNDSVVRRMTAALVDDVTVVPRADLSRSLSSACSERSLLERAGRQPANLMTSQDLGVPLHASIQHSSFNRPNTVEPSASVASRAKIRPGITVYY